HRAADPQDRGRVLVFRRDPSACWLDDHLRPETVQPGLELLEETTAEGARRRELELAWPPRAGPHEHRGADEMILQLLRGLVPAVRLAGSAPATGPVAPTPPAAARAPFPATTPAARVVPITTSSAEALAEYRKAVERLDALRRAEALAHLERALELD